MQSRRILFVLFLLLAVAPVTASKASAAPTIYYVSPTGSDKNSGTSTGSPWQTIARVNTVAFFPGDQILFQGGQAFNGSLYFDSADAGTAANPILVSSYGPGRAMINAGTAYGFYAYDTAGLRIANLNFVGAGRTTNTQSGINFYTDLPGTVKLGYVHIDNVTVSGFGDTGILIGARNADGYNDIHITFAVSRDNAKTGIATYGLASPSNTNVYVGHSKAFDNTGISGLTYHSGDGIVLGSVSGGTIERSLAHDNGALGFGGIGIWTYDSTNVTIQDNESYNNHTSGSTDGGGFDLDGGTSNSVLQYNYSHGNDGAGLGLYQYSGAPAWSGNTIRYNISENDGRKNSYSGIQLWNGGSGLSGAEIYNNTIYVSPASTGRTRAVFIASATTGVHIRNNILFTTGGLPLIDVASGQSGLLFQGNDYYANGGTVILRWSGVIYNSLNNWRTTTGQERLGTTNTGLSVDPQLNSPGGGGMIGNPDLLNTLSAYRLKSTSPMINAGLGLQQLFGLNAGPHDFYDTPIPQLGGFDLGANEATQLSLNARR